MRLLIRAQTDGPLGRAEVRSQGFTLVEILVALFVLAVGILGLASVQLNARRNNAFTELQSVALSIAEQRIELLRSAPSCSPNELQNGTGTDATCDQGVTYQNIALAVSCTYAEQCKGGATCPPNNYIELTVAVTTPLSQNPITLVGGKDIECP